MLYPYIAYVYRRLKNTVGVQYIVLINSLSFIQCHVILQFTHRPIDLVVDVKRKKNKFSAPNSKKSFLYPTELSCSLAIINLARRRCYFYWSSGKILKEDTVMLFGNNSWMTRKEMDFPSGWQFAAHGTWMCARSKSGCCQEWLSWECEPTSSKRRKDSTRLFCLCASPTQPQPYAFEP